ncbi:hypothetical protein [Hymenobacter terricola]|uniref:hypothetical protein n=1 Tax=Hymenobacter terricola TaxID=2819236 RepID=UPI001B310BD3|nr:hypothetical protein [Hymenobacter terricola]
MPSNSSLQLNYRPDLGVLMVRWLEDSTFPHLQDEYEAVLTAEPTQRTGRWLLDVRRRPTPTIEAANWVIYNWMPRAAATLLPDRLRIAYLISSLRAEALSSDPDIQISLQDALAPGRHYDMAVFGDEAEAVRWLTAA